MSEPISYSQIHAYMLRKTREYYQNPPAVLIEAVMQEQQSRGLPVTAEQARKLVTPIQIQRLIKQEMAELWPEFMASIPSNPLKPEDG